MPTLKRPLYGPSHPEGPSVGRDVKDFVKRTLSRYETDFFPPPPGGFDDVYNAKTQQAVRLFQQLEQIKPASGWFGQQTLDAMWEVADAYSKWVYRTWNASSPPPPVPWLGPAVAGGVPVSDHRLTHVTDGIAGYPAYDDGWIAGRLVLAPENLVVTEQSGSQGGDAFYAQGDSRIRHWFGHVLYAPATGKRFLRGQAMTSIANIPQYQGGPHLHHGLNARELGVELRATGYGGGPTVNEQLRLGMASV